MALLSFLSKELIKLEYSNPEIPEGINTSKEHPLKEFLLLAGGVLSSIAILILLLVLLSDFIVGYIPFSWEKKLSAPFTSTEKSIKHTDNTTLINNYLQKMADRITVAQNLPEDMTIKIHYLDRPSVNAFATLGGNVFFFRGLLEKLPNENALAMVMAHEIAHIKFRHPIQSLGRGVLAGLALSIVSSSAGDAIMENFISEAGILTILKFNRDMERDSDKAALESLVSIYGHIKGADDLFLVLQQENKNSEPYEFFSTHPLTENRISNIRNQSRQSSASETASVTPLPRDFKRWLQPEKSEPDSNPNETTPAEIDI